MNADRLSQIVARYKVAKEEHERAEAEAKRLAEEAAERRRRTESGWHFLQAKREEIVDEINAALSETGFQLQVVKRLEVPRDGEMDSFSVRFTGRRHPKLEVTWLRVALRESGFVVVDANDGNTIQPGMRLPFEKFSVAAWRDLLLNHLDAVVSAQQQLEDQREANKKAG